MLEDVSAEEEVEESMRMRPSTSRPSGESSSLMSPSFWDTFGLRVFSDSSTTDTIMEETNTMPVETLQQKFAHFMQMMEAGDEIFSVISQWADQVEITRNALRLTDLNLAEDVVKKLEQFLEKEGRTWDLLMRLYSDRLRKKEEGEELNLETQLAVIEKINEQSAINLIVGSNQELREVNIILDWLQASYAQKMEPQILKRDRALRVTTNENMVQHVDPDAILCEMKELNIHDDQDEEAKVNKRVFDYIRSGEFEEALTYLNESGHLAKAAELKGGNYTEKVPLDSENLENQPMESSSQSQQNLTSTVHIHNSSSSEVKYCIIGNVNRDMWRNTAFKTCERKKVSKYESASVGALCGHRSSLLNVSLTWEDKLWAHLKCLNDIGIEEELRSRWTDAESYTPMPEEYWSQKLSLIECLEEIEGSSTDSHVPPNHDDLFRSVQKKVLLDDVDGLMKILKEFVPHFFKEGSDHTILIGQVSRFLTHLILALGIMGLPYDVQLMDLCSETYVEVLVSANQLIYIPFYVNCMTESRQIPVILNQIDAEMNLSEEVISTFIRATATNGMKVLDIGVAVVQKLFSQQKDFSVDGLLWISETYPFVEDRNQVMLQLLRHVLIVTRKYLILGNIPKVKELLRLINQDCIKEILAISGKYDDTLIREYACYKSYMEGEDCVETWTEAKSQKPRMDDTSTQSQGKLPDHVLEKIKTRDFNILEWKRTVTHYLNESIEAFMELLTFPNGWLLDCLDSENDSNELAQLKSIRKILIPKVVFLLIKLIQESNSQRTMRDFLYVLCEDHRQILKEFSTASIARIFKAIGASTRGRTSTD